MATWCGSSWEDVNSSREQQMFRRGLALKRVLTGRYPPGPGGLGGILLGGWTGCIGWPGRQGLVWLHRSRLVGRRVIGVALGSFRTRSRVPVGFPARMVSLVPPSVGFPVPVARPLVSRVREPHDAPRSDALYLYYDMVPTSGGRRCHWPQRRKFVKEVTSGTQSKVTCCGYRNPDSRCTSTTRLCIEHCVSYV